MTRRQYILDNHKQKRLIITRDVRWLNIIWKHYRKKSIYARKQVELFLDEEEKSLEDERSLGESSIEEEEEEPKYDGNNTETQKRLGIDINMIGPRKETLGKPEVRQKNYHLQQMNPWKEQISQ